MPVTAPPPAGPPAQQQQPPFGSSPATGPTPNRGYEAAALQRVGALVKQATALLQLADPTTDLGKDLLKAINILAKHLQPGAVSPAAEQNNIQQQAMKNAQNNQAMMAMRQQQAGGQQQAAA